MATPKIYTFNISQKFKTGYGDQNIPKVEIEYYAVSTRSDFINVWLCVVWSDDSSNGKQMKLSDPYPIADIATSDVILINGTSYTRNVGNHYTDLMALGLNETNILNALAAIGYLNDGTIT